MLQKNNDYAAGYAKGLQDAFNSFKFGAKDFEPSKLWHFCECCDAEYFGTDEAAVENGWSLGRGEEFCPSHKY